MGHQARQALKPESRHLRRSFQVGLGGLAVIGLLVWLTFSAQYGNPFSSKDYVTAVFDDIHALQLKDPVRQNSKGIGRVSDIRYENGAAVVTLQIERSGDYEVYKDATAYIGDTSAVGAKFVGIDPGHESAGPLPNNVIPIEQTNDSQDLFRVLSLFDPAARTSTTSFLHEFGGGLNNPAGFADFMHNAPADLKGLGKFSSAFASKNADLPALLAASDRLSAHLRSRAPELASLIEQSEQTFAAISVDGGKPLADSLQRAPETLNELRTAVDSLNQPLADTRVAMTDFQPGAKSLGDADPDLHGFLDDSRPVLDEVPGVADDVTPAFEDLTPAFEDAQPLAPRAADGLNDFAEPLKVLAKYNKEIGYLFVRGRSFLSEGTADGKHYARFNATFQGPYSFTGGFLKACNFQTNPYPKPGEADHDHTKLGIGSNKPCGVAAPGLGGK